jgi:hypothetical protein
MVPSLVRGCRQTGATFEDTILLRAAEPRCGSVVVPLFEPRRTGSVPSARVAQLTHPSRPIPLIRTVLPRCAVCDAVLAGHGWQDPLFGLIWDDCRRRPRCLGCHVAIGGSDDRAPTPTSDGRPRCRSCARSAVDDQADVKRALPEVRSYFRNLGVELPNRVRVEVAPGRDIATAAGPSALAFTKKSRSEVLAVRAASGLPRTVFGMVVAHEIGHAWLVGCPSGGRSPMEEEGICELLASWWLRQRNDTLAEIHLRRMEKSPDPVYGRGYRLVRDRTRGLTQREVIQTVARVGSILGAPPR